MRLNGAAQALPAIEDRLEFPIVVKPAGQGSALGIKFARTAADVPNALVAACTMPIAGRLFDRVGARPPVLIGGYVDAVLKRAGTVGDGWLTYFYTPESFTKSWEKVKAFAREDYEQHRLEEQSLEGVEIALRGEIIGVDQRMLGGVHALQPDGAGGRVDHGCDEHVLRQRSRQRRRKRS